MTAKKTLTIRVSSEDAELLDLSLKDSPYNTLSKFLLNAGIKFQGSLGLMKMYRERIEFLEQEIQSRDDLISDAHSAAVALIDKTGQLDLIDDRCMNVSGSFEDGFS